MNKAVVPSLLSADFLELKSELERIESAGIKHLHLDVMDGSFVPNISFGPGVIKALRNSTEMLFDCHLMVDEPSHLFPAFADAGCEYLTVQEEAVKHLHRNIQEIHNLGMKAGVSLNPATPPSVLDYVMDDVDLILIMSVNPGFGGQEFISSALKKIEKAREMIKVSGREIVLEVDGGVKEFNLKDVYDAGCDWAVAGSAVFQRGKTFENAKKFQELVDEFNKN